MRYEYRKRLSEHYPHWILYPIIALDDVIFFFVNFEIHVLLVIDINIGSSDESADMCELRIEHCIIHNDFNHQKKDSLESET